MAIKIVEFLRKIFLRYTNRIASRWIIITLDLTIVLFCLIAAYVIRFNFNFSALNWIMISRVAVVYMVVSFISFLVFKSHISIIRHTSVTDAYRIIQALTSTTLLVLSYSLINQHFLHERSLVIPYSVILIFYFSSVFFLIFTRMFIKLAYQVIVRQADKKINVAIFGAGQLGLMTKNTLTTSTSTIYSVVAFFDENAGKVGKTIEGIRVYHPAEITSGLVERLKIKEVVFAIQKIDPAKKQLIFDTITRFNLTVKMVPPVDKWINGEFNVNQIERIKIEDLLQREPINLNNPKVLETLVGKNIMVTGAAGSIGSELVRQIIPKLPARLIMIDQAETPLFDLRMELLNDHPQFADRFVFYIADISNKLRMSQIFKEVKPDKIFHAAAYKHVPLMEENPLEAFRVNVAGTKVLADLAFKHKVRKFIMVSTDKAVNPTNVMGASKRIAEMYCQSYADEPGNVTRFITTRFGNVLGSNGSVVNIFYKQIEAGGPLTVTHPEITRFFMTIPEACQLVLEASTMGEDSEIFIFDMGKPVKIVDLASKMIRLAGYRPDVDIKITFTGLRPGEKLYEELLNDTEKVTQTYHPQILIANVKKWSREEIKILFGDLNQAYEHADADTIIGLFKQAIPEFISNNSAYSRFDAAEPSVSKA